MYTLWDFLSLLGNIEVACGIDRVDGKEVRFKQAVEGPDRGGEQAGMPRGSNLSVFLQTRVVVQQFRLHQRSGTDTPASRGAEGLPPRRARLSGPVRPTTWRLIVMS